LKEHATTEAVKAIAKALPNKADSTLLRHELAYVLGQMQDNEAIDVLSQVLRDISDDVIVRHECAEALGAICDESVLPILSEFSKDPAIEVSETCDIAIDLVKWKMKKTAAPSNTSSTSHDNPFHSVDPAPSLNRSKVKSLDELETVLLDTSLPLFKRYEAMFAIRNKNDSKAALVLCKGFDDKSSLFRHEIAYVLGQMMQSSTVSALTKVLENKNEHRMVRHEAAEALGSIGTEESEIVLKKFNANGVDTVVRESCEVALDIIDYWADEN
jgi:deoxyhypusine monooxygenase